MKYDLLERVVLKRAVLEGDLSKSVYSEALVLGRTQFAPRLQLEPEYLLQFELEGSNFLLWYPESNLHK